mmetsp:Transcript_19058/g.46793  ORF Transcript_19058/g.46793 Transcript_19058/m.46793 type:complete len:199 (-) Transcript_19058:200-796(-)
MALAMVAVVLIALRAATAAVSGGLGPDLRAAPSPSSPASSSPLRVRVRRLRGGRGGVNRRWKKVQARSQWEKEFADRARRKMRRLNLMEQEADGEKDEGEGKAHLYAARRRDRLRGKGETTSGFRTRKEASVTTKSKVETLRAVSFLKQKRRVRKERTQKRKKRFNRGVKGTIGSYLRRGMDPREYRLRRRRKFSGMK